MQDTTRPTADQGRRELVDFLTEILLERWLLQSKATLPDEGTTRKRQAA